MTRLSQLTAGYVQSKIAAWGSVQKAISIIYLESFENAGYAEHEVGDRVRELLS
jgi:hypothetical protein